MYARVRGGKRARNPIVSAATASAEAKGGLPRCCRIVSRSLCVCVPTSLTPGARMIVKQCGLALRFLSTLLRLPARAFLMRKCFTVVLRSIVSGNMLVFFNDEVI